MASKQQVQQLHNDLNALLKKDPHAVLSSTQMAIIRQLAEELQQSGKASAASTAKMVLEQVKPGSRLQASDGLALVGQLLSTLGIYD